MVANVLDDVVAAQARAGVELSLQVLDAGVLESLEDLVEFCVEAAQDRVVSKGAEIGEAPFVSPDATSASA